MRIIKFRRPFFRIKDETFSHFSYWGVDMRTDSGIETNFISPANSSHHYNKEDQQFTGLLDKNGREIFEGDVIMVISLNKFKEVFYHKCAFAIKITKEVIAPMYWHEDIEVIGNLYENPELL